MDGDQIMIEQVFFDLINNAVDAMPRGGVIDISIDSSYAKGDDGGFIVKISDTGEGISQSKLDRIFDPFFTTKDEGAGTGLGLHTVYLIVERHSGTIDVKSEEGKGTTFIIHLPMRQPLAAEGAEK